ncbi:MAG: helix-turn-helix domain-containing protein [Nanoarchaeota archaeon]
MALKKLKKEDVAQIVELYQNKNSSSKIASKFKISNVTVLRYLKKEEIETRDSSYCCRIKALDETVFDEINEESAYWIGFLMADGCVQQRGVNSFQIALALSEKDCEHVVKFKNFLRSGHKIIHENAKLGDAARISIFSKKIFEKLNYYGVIPNKTFVAKVYHLENNRHFWRGVIDGDGSFWIDKKTVPRFSLVGARPLLEQFIKFIKNNCCGVKTCKVVVHKNIFAVNLSGESAINIVRVLYESSNIFLTRKKEKARELINRGGFIREYKLNKRISIDLDGTINDYLNWIGDDDFPTIKVGAKNFLEILFNDGYDLILYSARTNREGICSWLRKENLLEYFYLVTNTKLPCFVYLDDRAVQFNGNFGKALEEIRNFKPYWKT